MTDTFQDFIRKEKAPVLSGHKERAHSKFSASGAERWFECPGSVDLAKDMPDTTNKWAEEGTRAHEILEAMLRIDLGDWGKFPLRDHIRALSFEKEGRDRNFTLRQHQEMKAHARATADFILKLGKEREAQILVETRIYLDFIHPEAFGTFDGGVLEFFGTLDVVDFKYGAKHTVSPRKNLQMIFYALALAAKYDWNFEDVRLWIDQPRSSGYDGPTFWQMTIEELRAWVPIFEDRVANVEFNPDVYVEGSWCHWCKAKKKCPVKREKKELEAKQIFLQSPVDDTDVLEYE